MLNTGKYIAVLMLLVGSLNLISGEAKNIKLSVYNGWKDSVIIEVPEAEVEAAIVPAIGGRIMRYELYATIHYMKTATPPVRLMKTLVKYSLSEVINAI